MELETHPILCSQARNPYVVGSIQSMGDFCLSIPGVTDFYQLSIHREYFFVICTKQIYVLLENMGKRKKSDAITS